MSCISSNAKLQEEKRQRKKRFCLIALLTTKRLKNGHTKNATNPQYNTKEKKKNRKKKRNINK